MNLHKMIEIYLKDDNMHIFVMINALICINNYVITCINSMLSNVHDSFILIKRIIGELQQVTYPLHVSKNEGLRLNLLPCLDPIALYVPHHLRI